MMKTKTALIITGNMGAGKSTVSQLIEKAQPNWKWFALDSFRNHAKKDKWAGEQEARKEFLYQFMNAKYVIYETVGMGQTHPTVMGLLKKHKIQYQVVKLVCNPEICHRRLMQRNSLPSFPKNYNLWDSLWKIQVALNSIHGFEVDAENNDAESVAKIIMGKKVG